jgi:hypothetical protein
MVADSAQQCKAQVFKTYLPPMLKIWKNHLSILPSLSYILKQTWCLSMWAVPGKFFQSLPVPCGASPDVTDSRKKKKSGAVWTGSFPRCNFPRCSYFSRCNFPRCNWLQTKKKSRAVWFFEAKDLIDQKKNI